LSFYEKFNSNIAKAYREKLDIETEGGTWDEPEELIQFRQSVMLQNENTTNDNQNQEEDQNLIINNQPPSIWGPPPEEERTEPGPNTNPTRRGGRAGIRVGGKVKAQENPLDPNLTYTPPFSSEINPFANSEPQSSIFTFSKGNYSENLTMGLFEGLVLNNTSNPKSDNTESNKFNNDTHNQISGNGYKPVEYKNISQMDNLNPKITNTQNQSIFAMEINPFDSSSGNPHLSTPQNMEPDPFSISNPSNHNISEIDPFQINTPTESLPTETDNTTQPKQDTQPRSIFSPEHVRDPFGLESGQEEKVQTKESILGKIGKLFFKK